MLPLKNMPDNEIQVTSRAGILSKVLTDPGTNFITQQIKEVFTLLGALKPPYHTILPPNWREGGVFD